MYFVVSVIENEQIDINVHANVDDAADASAALAGFIADHVPEAEVVNENYDLNNSSANVVVKIVKNIATMYRRETKISHGWFVDGVDSSLQKCGNYYLLPSDLVNTRSAANECINCSTENAAREKLRRQVKDLNDDIIMFKIKLDNAELEVSELSNKYNLRTEECKKLYNEIKRLKTTYSEEIHELLAKINHLEDERRNNVSLFKNMTTTTVNASPAYDDIVNQIKNFDRSTLKKVQRAKSLPDVNSAADTIVIPPWIKTLKN